jgi:hypothetical protein
MEDDTDWRDTLCPEFLSRRLELVKELSEESEVVKFVRLSLETRLPIAL